MLQAKFEATVNDMKNGNISKLGADASSKFDGS
jgi:hypothetical protein